MPLRADAPELSAHVARLAELGVLPPPPWWSKVQSLGIDKAFEDIGVLSSDWWHRNVTWKSLCKNYDDETGEVRDVVSWNPIDAADIVRLSDGNCYSRARLREWADAAPDGLTLLPLTQQPPTSEDYELLDIVDIAAWKEGKVPGNSELARKFARQEDYRSLFLLAAEFAQSFIASDSSLDLQSLNEIVRQFPDDLRKQVMPDLYNLYPKLKKRIEKHKIDPQLLLWQTGEAQADVSFAPLLAKQGDVDSLLKLAREYAKKFLATREKQDFEDLEYIVSHFPRESRTYVANVLHEQHPDLFQAIRKYSYTLTPDIDVLTYAIA